MKATYQPISCSFYDFLEAAAATQKIVDIEFLNADNAIEQIRAQVKDLYAKNGEEFMLLNNDQQLRLDTLISFDGQVLAEFGGACAIHPSYIVLQGLFMKNKEMRLQVVARLILIVDSNENISKPFEFR